MALGNILLEIGVKLLIGVMLVCFGSLVLWEIVSKLFRVEDDSISTASAVVTWTAIIMLIFSFIPIIPYVGWVLAAAVNIIFMLLVRKYYQTPWNMTVKIWGVWFASYLIIAGVVAATVSIVL